MYNALDKLLALFKYKILKLRLFCIWFFSHRGLIAVYISLNF